MALNMFITFLNMSISGTLAAVMLILWRYVSYKYIPSKFYYVLWLVLMFRFVVPFNIKSIFSVLNLFEKAGNFSHGNSYVVTMEYLDYTNLVAAEAGTVSDVLRIASVIWLAAAVFFIGQWLYVALSAARHLQYAVLYKDSVVEQIKADIGLKRKVNVFTSANVVSPIVTGFWKPRIVLPKVETLSDEDKKYTVAHEMVHIKRYDNVLKPLFYFVVAMHWFNPLVWYSFWLFNEDIELSCDQQVLGIYGAEHKFRYACSLFEHANRKNAFRLGYLYFAKDKVSARIEKVLEYKHLSAPKAVAFTVVTVLIGLCATTNPVFAADHHYVPKTVYVNSQTRNDMKQFVNEFVNDIETNNINAIISKSTADSAYLAHTYSAFKNSHIDLEIEKVFHTSQSTADVYLKLVENDGTVFSPETEKIVMQVGSNKVMGGLYADNLQSYEKYNSINLIDQNDEAVQIVNKMIKLGLTDGQNTQRNAPKITAFCMDMAYDRGTDKNRTHIPQKEVEDIAKEFFLIDDFSNLHNTDYYIKNQSAYAYNKSIGSHYEYAIIAFEKTDLQAVVTVEFYKDPLQTQVDKVIKYTLKKV